MLFLELLQVLNKLREITTSFLLKKQKDEIWRGHGTRKQLQFKGNKQ